MGESTKKHYVTFLSPGSFVSEQTSQEVPSWDPELAVAMSRKITERHGATPYGFYFETRRTSAPIIVDGDELKVEPKVLTTSGIHFIGGRLRTYDEVVADGEPDESILRDNMRWNNMWIVCEVIRGYKTTTPFGESDFVVNEQGTILERGDDPQHVAYRKAQTKKADLL